MRTYLSLSWKELKVQKVTSVLILIAVILSSAATTAMGQSIGILNTLRIKQASGLNGDRYATFHQLTQEQDELLHSDTRLKDVGSVIYLGNVELKDSSLTLFLREYQGEALRAYPSVGTIKEGRIPKEKGEIALSEDTLKYLGIEGRLGSVITLPVEVGLKEDDRPPYEYTADFVLTGILENNYMGFSSGTIDGVVGEGTAKTLLPERYFLYSTDFKTMSTGEFQSIVDDLASKLRLSENDIQYNWVLLNALGVDYAEKEKQDGDKGFPFMMAACILAGGLVLLAAGLVIYNILKVSVTKHIREYGTLRAMGSRRGQLYALVTVRILILCGIGLPVGLLLGVLSAKGILIAATGLMNPDLFLAENTQALNTAISESGVGGLLPLTASVCITLLFAVLAAYPSARYAACVSPTAAMNGQRMKVKRRGRRQRRIRNFEAFYARLNLRRNRSRTAITILSIVMSITVFVALQSFSGLLDASRDTQRMLAGDYEVANETAGMSPKAVEQLKAHEMVEVLSTAKLMVYEMDEDGNVAIPIDIDLHPGESFQIAAADERLLEDYGFGLSKNDMEEVKNGTACLVKNPISITYQGQEIEHTEVEKDDIITVNGTRLRVVKIAENSIDAGRDWLNGVQVIVSDSLYDTLTGSDRYAAIYPILKESADPELFEEWLAQWCDANPGSHWLSFQETYAQMAESFEQIRFLCWGLILFIGLIGILNIINTVYTNIHTRIQEIGMQRAVGMSVPGLYRTFLWEGAYYGLIASILGAILGYICTIFIGAAATDSFGVTAFPVTAVLEASVVSVASCLAATVVPLRTIGRLSIVDSIEAACRF